jgi:membrane-bound lytic murein transglycosylase D
LRQLVHIIFLSILFTTQGVSAQSDTTKKIDLSFVDVYDKKILDHFKLLNQFARDTNEYYRLVTHKDSIKQVDDEIIVKRVRKMDEASPFDFVANEATMAMIKLYTYKRYKLTARMMGMGEYYFPIFEEKLIANNMPLELKYLPIVESALNPGAVSHAGAGGLWQFMPGTGKSYGLDITSYIDERNDPYLSTEAACLYLKKLYKIYGDWSMALAAYNAGPGNVNKAIRRANGKTDFWSIREFLPKETQNYVPAFIAVNYAMKYATHHNIYPIKPEFLNIEIDTVHVCHRIEFGVLEHWLAYSRTKLRYLNPMFKTDIIPEVDSSYTLYLPVNLLGKYFQFEDSIYKYSSLDYKYWVAGNQPNRVERNHTIKSGETLAIIAAKYNVSEQEIRAWNTKSSDYLKVGGTLLIYESKGGGSGSYTTPSAQPKEELATNKTTTNTSGIAPSTTPPKNTTSTTPPSTSTQYTYYTVQKGDTMWSISQKYKVQVDELIAHNKSLNAKGLHAGDKVKIPKKT